MTASSDAGRSCGAPQNPARIPSIHRSPSLFANPVHLLHASSLSCHSFRAILIGLSVIVVPFRIGFDWMPQGMWLVADLVTDFAFAFDIVLSFRTAYEVGQILVTSPKLMALHYLKGWFAIDFLSTVPFDR